MAEHRAVPVVSAAEARETPYPYVWVNEDLSARELHAAERRFLETPYAFDDGARPYVKSGLSTKDGWKRHSGFCHRRHLRGGQTVLPAPAEDPHPPMDRAAFIEFLKHGDPAIEVIERADGTLLVQHAGGPHRQGLAGRLGSWIKKLVSRHSTPDT